MTTHSFTQPPAASIELDSEARGYLEALKQLNAQAAELDEHRALIRERLEKILGDAEQGTVGGRPVITWRWDKPSTVADLARLKTEYPDVWAAVQKPRKPSRPLKFITRDADA